MCLPALQQAPPCLLSRIPAVHKYAPVHVQVEDSRINGVHKGTVVRGELDCPSGQLHITDCHDTIVYALAPLQVSPPAQRVLKQTHTRRCRAGQVWKAWG